MNNYRVSQLLPRTRGRQDSPGCQELAGWLSHARPRARDAPWEHSPEVAVTAGLRNPAAQRPALMWSPLGCSRPPCRWPPCPTWLSRSRHPDPADSERWLRLAQHTGDADSWQPLDTHRVLSGTVRRAWREQADFDSPQLPYEGDVANTQPLLPSPWSQMWLRIQKLWDFRKRLRQICCISLMRTQDPGGFP